MNALYNNIHNFNSLNNNLKGFTPILDSTGKITDYKTEAGADTVFPFSAAFEKGSFTVTLNPTHAGKTITFNKPFSTVPIVVVSRKGSSGVYGSITNITTTGCTFDVSSTNNNDRNATITWYWAAFEPE